MKQYKLIKAYKATESLSHNDKLPVNILWTIYKVRKELYPHWEFQMEREKDIKAKYSKYADENGNLTGEFLKKYIEELNTLINTEIEVKFNKFVLPLRDDIGLTVEMMEDLEDFIEFTD